MSVRIITGDALHVLRGLSDETFQCCITSPPYWTQVDYGAEGQMGLEATMDLHLDRLSEVLGEVRRVLRRDGTLWLNYSDGYNTCNGGPGPNTHRAWMRKRKRMPKLATGNGLKTRVVKRKSLFGLPWRLALRLEAAGWYLRSEIIWKKPTPCEAKQRLDRPVRAHEHLFLLAKSERYLFRGPTDSVWEIAPRPYPGHPAPFPPELARRCIEHGSEVGSEICDPFGGSGTVGLEADRLGRNATLIELNPDFAELARRRIKEDSPLFADVEVAAAPHQSQENTWTS